LALPRPGNQEILNIAISSIDFIVASRRPSPEIPALY
jgi:hypothetical protein